MSCLHCSTFFPFFVNVLLYLWTVRGEQAKIWRVFHGTFFRVRRRAQDIQLYKRWLIQCFWRDSVTRFFASGFFHESFFPQPQSIPLGTFRIFSKIRGDIRNSRCTTGINDTGNLPTVSRTPAANFSTSFASVVDTGGKFATGVNNIGAKSILTWVE